MPIPRGQLATPAREEFAVPAVLSTHLVRYLEDKIIFGEIAPGERLIEDEIVQRYKISRSPVREALRALEQEGLAQRESRRGVWVSPLTLANLDEVYTCRVALEGLATELAARNRTDEHLRAIAHAIDELAAAYKAKDVRSFFRRNILLSERIHAATLNTTMQRILLSIGKQSLRYRYLAYSQAPEMMLASIEGHREILGAIKRQDATQARLLMEGLVQRSWDVIRQHFAEAETRAAVVAGPRS